jgi:glycosyltransferase involved in cell wall biosynthesis
MISVIIPTLNEEKNLANIISNLREQKFYNYEIVVSDGYSEDNTEKIAIENRCKFIKSKKRSPAHQRNNGVKLAKGEYLLFLDADSRIPNDFLETAFIEFKDRKLGIASFYLRFNSKKLIYKIYNRLYGLFCYLLQYYKPLSVGAATMVEKSLHLMSGGFDESILVGEDHEYAWRVKKISKFRMIKSTYFLFSPRRWEKEGHLITFFKLFKMSIYILFNGPIRKKIIRYDFGHY